MAKHEMELRKTDTIWNDLDRLHRQISQRAYDLFRDRGPLWGGALGDWLSAERELVWKPAVELRQKDGQFELLAATPGVEPKDLNVQITAEAVLIQADVNHDHGDNAVAVCEFVAGKLFRSIHFPERIDPESVKAEYRNGMLRLTAAISKQVPRTVDVKAA